MFVNSFIVAAVTCTFLATCVSRWVLKGGGNPTPVPRCAGHAHEPDRGAHQGQEAQSLITFTVQTVAAGLDAQGIKSSLRSLHAINQTM